jgi:hypothetical protein
MGIIKKLLGKVKLLWHSLFIGMKNVDVILTTNQTNGNNSKYEIPENGGNSVYADLLQEKVTQAVEELRYVSYHVANESKKYRYIGNGNAVRKTDSQLKEKHVIIDESDNLDILIIQDNKIICEDVLTLLKEVDTTNNKKVRNDYVIKINRELVPRFYIEDYVKKVVVKNAEDNFVLDLYCSMYPRQFSEKKDRSFINELKRIKNGYRNSDILDFTQISWVSFNAWGSDDWMRYEFEDFEFYDIIEFDGNYIIRLGCKSNNFGFNLLDKIYSASADKKYQQKEMKKGAVIQLFKPDKEEYNISDDINLDKIKSIDFFIENDE